MRRIFDDARAVGSERQKRSGLFVGEDFQGQLAGVVDVRAAHQVVISRSGSPLGAAGPLWERLGQCGHWADRRRRQLLVALRSLDQLLRRTTAVLLPEDSTRSRPSENALCLKPS